MGQTDAHRYRLDKGKFHLEPFFFKENVLGFAQDIYYNSFAILLEKVLRGATPPLSRLRLIVKVMMILTF